ncbi:iron ABC transporter permease [Paenibacillus sp. TRM 82003]|nr:iron ABC transporter permease [Paenibacillus sp. TRM 82003]
MRANISEIHRIRTKKSMTLVVSISTLLFLTFIVSMNTGTVQLSPLEVWSTLFGDGSRKQEIILYHLRLPRMVIAVMVGAGLAVSGAILQGISRNGLSDPGILGINAGAGLAVLALVSMAPSRQMADPFVLPFFALVGASLTAVLIYLLAYKKGQGMTPTRLLLVGIAVAAGLSAVTVILTLKLNPENFNFVLQWNLGTLWGANWDFVLALLPWSLLLLPFAFMKSHMLNILSLNDSIGTGLGLSLEREKLILLAVAVGLAASAVATGGGIGFIGLIAPHMARRLVGPKHQFMLPVTAMAGALLVLAGDTIARSVMEYSEIPAGVVISLLGAPYFLYLLIKSK